MTSAELVEQVTSVGFTAALAPVLCREVQISIEGMTCMNCVRHIEGNLVTKDGVKFAKVSLEERLGIVCYDPAKITDEKIVDVVNDMGFICKLFEAVESDALSKDLTNVSDERVTLTCKIEGMTCNSCVRSIEEALRNLPGVESVEVFLEQEKGVVKLNPKLTDQTKILNLINDIGYVAEVWTDVVDSEGGTCKAVVEGGMKGAVFVWDQPASLKCSEDQIVNGLKEIPGLSSINCNLESRSVSLMYDSIVTSLGDAAEKLKQMGFNACVKCDGSIEECRISIKGMTCHSCIKSIQSRLEEMPGILNIQISLAEQRAVVSIIRSCVQASEIVDAIDCLGFEACLESGVSVREADIQGCSDDSIEGVIKIDGMHCASCTRSIEGKLKEVAGVVDVKVSLEEKLARVRYKLSVVSLEELRSVVEKAGDFTATLASGE